MTDQRKPRRVATEEAARIIELSAEALRRGEWNEGAYLFFRIRSPADEVSLCTKGIPGIDDNEDLVSSCSARMLIRRLAQKAGVEPAMPSQEPVTTETPGDAAYKDEVARAMDAHGSAGPEVVIELLLVPAPELTFMLNTLARNLRAGLGDGTVHAAACAAPSAPGSYGVRVIRFAA